MRTKTVLAVLCLLMMQSFSASFAVIPETNDMDLFFPEASETSARNNSSNEYVDIDHSGYVWETPNMVEVWDSGTDVDVQFTSGNLIIGDTYQLIWNLSDSTSNVGVYDWGNVNWNATSTTSVENSTISGLADGVYYFHATLVETSNWTHIATDMTQIQMGNTTGGNNTGGNNSGGNNGGGTTGGNNTGTNASEYVDIDHSGYVWETPNMVEVWASGTDVDVQFTSGNLVIGESYQLIWNLSDSTSNVGIHAWGNVNWYASSDISVENGTVSGLADGVYYFHATLVHNSSHIATDMTMIQMGNSTGGNNTGGGNNGGGNSMHNNSTGGGGSIGGNKPGDNSTGNNTNGSVASGTSSANPLMPIVDCDDIPWNDTNFTSTTNITIDDCANSTGEFWFWFNQTGKMTWLDPLVATGYDFVVYSGPAMSSVEIPPGYGDDVFDLYLYGVNGWYDTNIDITAGVAYFFQSPVERMSIRGIEAYEMLDPNDPTAFVAGIAFANSGSVLMTMTPITENYTMQGCGFDPSLTDLMIWTDYQTYQQGTTTYADYVVNCSVSTKDYELHVFAYSTSGSSWNDFQVWNWTETDAYEFMEDDWTNLSPATYCINATLYMVSGSAYQFVDFEVTCFTVTGNNNGGGGSGGGTVDPCGLNSSYTVVMSWSDAQSYNYGDDQNMSFYVNCTRIGESYTLEYYVYDITDPNNYVSSGMYSWTAATTWEAWNDIVTGLSPGEYCVLTNLYQANVYLTSGYNYIPHCFEVIGTSVNSPPTLTQTTQALVAYAADPLNCYDNGMTYSDPDNDPDQSIITWFVNNAQIATGVQAPLPYGTVAVGDQLHCEAVAHDGFAAGNTLIRSYYVLPANNTAPSISAVTISPTSPQETDTLTCSYTYTDPDNDPDASILIWSINGVATTTQGSTLSSGYVAGDFVTCSVTAFDGSYAGNTGTGTVLVMTSGGGSTPTIGVFGTLAVLSVAFILVSRKEVEE